MKEIEQFNEMEISEGVSKAIEDMGYIEPSPIQKKAIPILLERRDMIGQAQTGTGKTAAFGIPIAESVDFSERKIQALVLTPTRELAIQVAGEMNKLVKYEKYASILPVYGGQSIDRQIRALKKGVQIVIATPGRLIDHIRRKTIRLDYVQFFVLDEADEMLDMGFIDDVYDIMKNINTDASQIALFSATMPKEIINLSGRFMKEPELVKIQHKQLTVPNIKQLYYEVRHGDKPELLTRLIDYYSPNLAIVFANTKVGVEDLKEKVHTAGYSVEALHGDMKQTQRDYVMKRFRNGDFEILIATDVAARGIDVDDIDIVFNYDLPQDVEYYIHRVGRTARAGKEGMALSFVTMKEFRKLKEIERTSKTKIKKQRIPSVKDVENMRNQAFIERVRETIEEDEGALGSYISLISEALNDYDSIEIAAALMKLIMERKTPQEEISELAHSRNDNEEKRFFITLGKKDGLTKKELVGWVRENTGISARYLGDITFLEKFSFISVPAQFIGQFLEAMEGLKFKGKRIHIEEANPKKRR